MVIEGLLPSQVADLARAIVASGFPLSEFRGGELDRSFPGYTPVPGIEHIPTGAWFGIAMGYYLPNRRQHGKVDKRVIGWSPGNERLEETFTGPDWPGVMAHFNAWLGFVKREVEAGDVWSALEAGIGETNARPEDPERERVPFTAGEASSIAERLAAIEEQLAAAAVAASDSDAYVRREFADLRDQLSKMQRGRWKKLFLGTLASMAVRRAVPEGAIRAALEAGRDFVVDSAHRLLPP